MNSNIKFGLNVETNDTHQHTPRGVMKIFTTYISETFLEKAGQVDCLGDFVGFRDEAQAEGVAWERGLCGLNL